MEKTFQPNWLPVFAGGLLVGAATITPVSEGIRGADDFLCAFARTVVACESAGLPVSDLPEPDHAPAAPSSITTTVVSTGTLAVPLYAGTASTSTSTATSRVIGAPKP